MDLQFGLFASLFASFVAPVQAAAAQIDSALVGYVAGPVRVGSVIYLGIWFATWAFNPSEGGMNKALVQMVKLALGAYFVSTAAIYSQYVANLFLNVLPQELTNAAMGVSGAPAVNGASFDGAWASAWGAGEFVYDHLSSWNPKEVGMAVLVALYWLAAIVAIGLSFLEYAVCYVDIALGVAIGPIFVAMWPFGQLRQFFDGWFRTLSGGVLCQLLIVVLLSLLMKAENTMVATLSVLQASAGHGNGKIAQELHVLINMLLLLAAVAYIAKRLGAYAVSIVGGFARTVGEFGQWAAGKAAAVALPVAGKAAGAAAPLVTGGGTFGGASGLGLSKSVGRSMS